MRDDFELSGGDPVYLLRPRTRAARAWVQEHLPPDARWLGGAVAVEHRYIGSIIDGATGDGLTVRCLKSPLMFDALGRRGARANEHGASAPTTAYCKTLST